MLVLTREDGRALWSVKLAGVTLLLLGALSLLSLLPAGELPTDGWEWLEHAGLHRQMDLELSPPSECAPCPTPSALSCPIAACEPLPELPLAPLDAPPPIASSCGVDPDILRTYGRHSVRLSRAHEGSGFRVQRFLAKARRGDKVKLAVLGGSVSLGHGKAGPVTLGRFDQIWHQYVLRYLQSTFPPDQVEYVHGAKAGCGSDYFSWCYPAHISLDVDLVLIESAVNDGFSEEYFRAAENLLRSVLALPNEPAVMYVDSFALDNAMGQKASLNGGDAHNHLALRYDIPAISLRAAGLTALMEDQELVEPWFRGDKHHITVPQHEMLGQLVVAYLEEQGCELDRGGWEREMVGWVPEEGLPGMETLGQIPKNPIEAAWDSTLSYPSAPPTCQLAAPPGSPSELTPVAPAESWELFDWMSAKYYYQTTTPDAPPILFKVQVREGAKGEVAMGYLRSAQYDLGQARCRVVGMEGEGEVMDGHWEASTSVAQIAVIARGVPPGEWEVECRTLPAGEQTGGRYGFRIMSLMSV